MPRDPRYELGCMGGHRSDCAQLPKSGIPSRRNPGMHRYALRPEIQTCRRPRDWGGRPRAWRHHFRFMEVVGTFTTCVSRKPNSLLEMDIFAAANSPFRQLGFRKMRIRQGIFHVHLGRKSSLIHIKGARFREGIGTGFLLAGRPYGVLFPNHSRGLFRRPRGSSSPPRCHQRCVQRSAIPVRGI